jgi:poly(U)-specific endoribonuclease
VLALIVAVHASPKRFFGKKLRRPIKIVGDTALQTVTANMYEQDTNRIDVTYSIQSEAGSGTTDNAPDPLFSTLDSDVFTADTYTTVFPLLDNYNMDTSQSETQTSDEVTEQDAFLDAVVATDVFALASDYLVENGYVDSATALRTYMSQIWFETFDRDGVKNSSCGFEHIFIGEVSDGDYEGLHNWVGYYHLEEELDEINYLGHYETIELTDLSVLSFRFTRSGYLKSDSTMFVGSSPEFDVSIMTLCFMTYPNTYCETMLDDTEVDVDSYSFDEGDRTHISAAYPDIYDE